MEQNDSKPEGSYLRKAENCDKYRPATCQLKDVVNHINGQILYGVDSSMAISIYRLATNKMTLGTLSGL